MTRQNLLQLDWEDLINLPYLSDIAPSDFHLFQSLQNSFNEKKFSSLEDYKRHLKHFFALKDKKVWEDGTMKLPGKWQKVVEQNGKLFNKIHGESENYVLFFFFKLKNQRMFLASPIYCLSQVREVFSHYFFRQAYYPFVYFSYCRASII